MQGSLLALRSVTLFVPGVPVPQGSMKAMPNPKDHRRPFIIHDSGPDLRKWRNFVAQCAAIKWGGPPTEKFVSMALEFVMPRESVTEKGQVRIARTQFPLPDRDKLLRAVQDALTKVVYVDDNRVADGPTKKRFARAGESPGVHICITEIESEG